MTTPDAALPPFSEYSICPKCRCTDVGVAFRKAAWRSYDARDLPIAVETMHCLTRWCRRCHYRWAEGVLE